jgi:hypothetical protein
MLRTNENERKKNDEHEIDNVEIGYDCLNVYKLSNSSFGIEDYLKYLNLINNIKKKNVHGLFLIQNVH